jgi:phosphonate transport system substrate-binding protein
LTRSRGPATIARVQASSISRRTFLAALAIACAACPAPRAEPGRDRPLVVVFGPQHAPRNSEALRARLARASGLELEFRTAASSSAAIDLVQAGRADAGLLPLFDYLFCADVFGVEPLAQVLRDGGRTTHTGELVVLAGSELRGVSDLRGRRVGYVDRFSVTGFILPAAQIREAGVAVESVWLGSHAAVLAAVRDDRVAAGATYSGHAATDPRLRVLASTGTIANEPVFVQASMPADVRQALRNALLAERGPSVLGGLAGATGFRAPPAGTYEAALATVTSAGRRVEDLVPAGWQRANEHRRPLWSYAP